MSYLQNAFLLACEMVLYFAVMTTLFRMRDRFGIGIFFCALGAMHFLETYLAAILYIQFPLGITISPGSTVLFAGKLVMLLLVYMREDAAAVRQPIYGLLVGNLLTIGLVFLLRFHVLGAAIPGQSPDFEFMDQMGWLMIWGTLLLFADSLLIVLLYERLGAWLTRHRTLRIVLSAALVLTFDQVGFFAALHFLLGVPYAVFMGGWIAKLITGTIYALMTGFYLRYVEKGEERAIAPPKLSDLFDTLTYRQRYEALLRQSGRDSLTGLLDRGRFDREVARAVREAVEAGRPLSLLVIDLDHFKEINDRHGHVVGDDVLRHVAGEIAATTRGSDRIYRYGGEEFVVLCDGLVHAQAMLAADRLRRRVAATALPVLQRSITASVGVATTPEDGVDLAELFAVADGRLYGAKEAGRDCVRGRPERRTAPATDRAVDDRRTA